MSSPSRTSLLLLAATALPVIAMASPGHADPTQVVVTDKGCKPDTLTVEEGRSSFKIRNESQRALEWEILNGVMVVEERENIIPGFTQSLTATLEPGEYSMTCGLLSNPKGRLIVTAAAKSAPAKPVDPRELVAPLAEYKVYVTREVDALVTETKAFADAIKSGDLATAQRLYAPTRLHYERIEPVAELFDDLDKSIDVRADDFEAKEADPNFKGFHRIEKGLFADKNTTGLESLADGLLTDVTELQKRIAALPIPPEKMVGGAAGLVEEVAATKISGEEDRYSGTDLWDFQANVDGSKQIFALVRPLLAKRQAPLVSRVDKQFAKVDDLLAKYRTADGGFEPYGRLNPKDRNALKASITALAEDLSSLRGALGLD